MTSIGHPSAAHNARPFEGQGASLYVQVDGQPLYRRMRIGPRTRSVLRQGWSGRNPKTIRVAKLNGVSDDQLDFAYALPAALAGQTIAVDVRHFRDDVENLASDPVIVTLDASRDPVAAIRGTATWLDPDILAGGIVRLRWVWHPDDTGVQPSRFRVVFTAGPTSPADLTLDIDDVDQRDFELETGALADSGPYTVRLEAETDTVTAVLTSGRQFTADASGPPTPTLLSKGAV